MEKKRKESQGESPATATATTANDSWTNWNCQTFKGNKWASFKSNVPPNRVRNRMRCSRMCVIMIVSNWDSLWQALDFSLAFCIICERLLVFPSTLIASVPPFAFIAPLTFCADGLVTIRVVHAALAFNGALPSRVAEHRRHYAQAEQQPLEQHLMETEKRKKGGERRRIEGYSSISVAVVCGFWNAISDGLPLWQPLLRAITFAMNIFV